MGIASVSAESEFLILEKRLAMPAASESRETLSALLALDFREFGSSGHVYDARTVLDALVSTDRPPLEFEDFKVTALADGAVLVTYVARSPSGPGWKPPTLRSSLWCRREDRWQLLFHQGTRLASDLT